LEAQRNGTHAGVSSLIDIIICDGSCTDETRLKNLGINTLLTKISLGGKMHNCEWGFGGV